MAASESIPAADPPQVTTTGAYLALAAALLGWMFDGAEMGLFSLVGRKAIQDLMGFGLTPSKEQEELIGLYFGIIIAVFLVGAATGGVLFGWLGDRIGRVRAMSFSVLVYAIFTGLCGLATAPWQVAVLRFIASLGMGGEWALGVALVMEIWPNRSRAFMAGLIGAAANVGYLLVGMVGLVLVNFLDNAGQFLLSIGLHEETVRSLTAFNGWRLMMLLGTLPAFLTLFFRFFVPESQKWEAEEAKGSTSSWATVDLLGVLVGAAGPLLIVFCWAQRDWSIAIKIAATILGLGIAAVGYTWPVIGFVQRQTEKQGAPPGAWRAIVGMMLLGACLSGIALIGTWGSTQWAPSWIGKLLSDKFAAMQAAGQVVPAAMLEEAKFAPQWTLLFTSLGAIVGCVAAAFAGDWIGRRPAYFLLCLLSFAASQGLFYFNHDYNNAFLAWVFLQGATTAAFYGWLPLYLPELFGTSVRATGQGFAFNFGRILAAVAALNSGALLKFFNSDYAQVGAITCCVYILGMVVIWFAPETNGKELPE